MLMGQIFCFISSSYRSAFCKSNANCLTYSILSETIQRGDISIIYIFKVNDMSFEWYINCPSRVSLDEAMR